MIIIIGAGKFGQSVSKLLQAKHQFVDIEADGTYSADNVEKIKNAEKLIICVPSGALAGCVNMISGIVNPKTPILSCVKGLFENLETPTGLIKSRLKNPVAALMGPNLSVEIMLGRPAFAVVAGDFDDEWAELFNSADFKAVTGTDMVGVEFGGAIKNIVALGAGLLDGFFDGNACNAMGGFAAFALRDIEHLYGHKCASDIPKLSFIGDLFATCMSETSRNHEFGHKYGIALRFNSPLPKPEQTVEGYRTLQIVQKYADQHKFRIPTITALYNVFFGKGRIDDIVGSWT